MFFDSLRKGINLFTGAGFSKLPAPDGKKLPDAKDLCEEICKKFNISPLYKEDLEKISSVLKRNCNSQFQEYLRAKFTVNAYNPLYNILNEINIRSYITTNIDNLFQCIIDHSSRYYLNSVTYYGAAKNDGEAIDYIPLHGDVKDLNSELYFGKFELSRVAHNNDALFSLLYSKLLLTPTLFWGYGFHDGSVLNVIDSVLEKTKKNIWIQCMPGDENVAFFRDLGLYVVEGSTEDFLKEIHDELSKDKIETFGKIDNKIWDKYLIPSMNQVESLPIKDYYEFGKTHWYYIITEQAYNTKMVDISREKLYDNKNLVIVGLPFGGKTTLLMQIARKIDEIVYFIPELTLEQAKLLYNTVDKNVVVIVDNCADDMMAFKLLAGHSKIKLIGAADDFSFESSKHLIDGVDYEKIPIADLEIDEAQRIYENIPLNIRTKEFNFSKKENEKYSIFELITENIENIISEDRIKKFLERVKHNDYEVFEIILLTAYLTHNKSTLSTDVVMQYMEIDSYDKVSELIHKTDIILTEVDVKLEPDAVDQDYFSLRSNLFAKFSHDVAKKYFCNEYSKIISKFVYNVYPYVVYKYYIFKRRAYDAELFYALFGKEGDTIYEKIYSYDPNAYTLQQWALYKAK